MLVGSIMVLESPQGIVVYLSGASQEAALIPESPGSLRFVFDTELLGAGQIEVAAIVLQVGEETRVKRETNEVSSKVPARVDLICHQHGDGIHVTLSIGETPAVGTPATLTSVIVDTTTIGRAQFAPTSFPSPSESAR